MLCHYNLSSYPPGLSAQQTQLLNGKLEVLESEKRELALLVDRRNKEIDDLKSEIEMIRKRLLLITSEKMQSQRRTFRRKTAGKKQLCERLGTVVDHNCLSFVFGS